MTLSQLLKPRSIAVIGASEDQAKFGGRLFKMLLRHGYEGNIYPIHGVRAEVFGIQAYRTVSDTPTPPDMVVMAVPRDAVLEQVEIAGRRGARYGLIITAKFSEENEEGARLERELVQAARRHGMRLIGPNCLGVISPAHRLVLCSSSAVDVDALLPGSIGFVSQSGALMATLFDQASARGIGFSHCISVGNQADLELCDLVELLIDDPATQVICSYVEGLRNPLRLAQVARKARLAGKPWLAVKSGRTDAGSRAAFSHTASIAGSHTVFESVCRDEQITLLDSPEAMLTLASLMASRPEGPFAKVAVISTSGGSAALAIDALSEAGLEPAEFGAQTRQRLGRIYAERHLHNPVDLGAYSAEGASDFARASAQIVVQDPDSDVVVLSMTTAPRLSLLVEDLCEGLRQVPQARRKAAIAVVQAGHSGQAARDALCSRGIPYTNTSHEALAALAALRRHHEFVEREVPRRPVGIEAPVAALAAELNELSSKALLASYGIPVNRGGLATSAESAATIAQDIGFPVVLKVASAQIAHKSDIGGVLIGIDSPSRAREGFELLQRRAREAAPHATLDGVLVQAQVAGGLELIVGARRDPQFGPVVLFGAGGVLVELLRQTGVSRAPIAQADIRALLRKLSIWPLLSGYRGKALALDAVVDVIERVSWLAHDFAAWDFELDINPLIVDGRGCTAVDARFRATRVQETPAP